MVTRSVLMLPSLRKRSSQRSPADFSPGTEVPLATTWRFAKLCGIQPVGEKYRSYWKTFVSSESRRGPEKPALVKPAAMAATRMAELTAASVAAGVPRVQAARPRSRTSWPQPGQVNSVSSAAGVWQRAQL